MAYDPRRAGQAMSEFMVAVLALILLIVAMVEFVPVFLDNIGLLKEVREEAGAKSISADTGMALSDRKDEFGFDVPGIFPDDSYTSGSFAEKIRLPAANLSATEFASIGKPPNFEETMRCPKDSSQPRFLAGYSSLNPSAAARSAMGGWLLSDVIYEDSENNECACLFYQGDRNAPSAVAAAHAGYVFDENGNQRTFLTIVARPAGGEM